MPESAQIDYKDTELDPDLLLTPFKVRTRWHVITGGPSCGKTTLINLLAAKGCRTVPESARSYLEREIARGRTVDQIRADVAGMQRGITDLQLEVERGLGADVFTVLDRGVPDMMAWYRAFGLDPNAILPDCFHHRYASVFILDPLPVQIDNLRIKDKNLQGFTEAWHVRDYEALGYRIVRVPVLPPEERLAFVLEQFL